MFSQMFLFEARLPEVSTSYMVFDTTGLLAGVDDVGTSAIDVGHTKNDEEFGS